MSYAVLFRDFPMERLDELAPVVRQAYGITDYDARSKIRKGWGFLERNATEEKARKISAVLGDVVIVVAAAELKTPGDSITMTGFTVEPEGLVPRWQSPQEPGRMVAWSEIKIVAAGGFSEEIIARDAGGGGQKMGQMLMGLGIFAVTGIPVNIFGGGKDKKSAKPAKSNRLITFGCLITRQGEQFAFSPEKFDFAGLGANKQLNTAANFRAFIAELKGRTPASLNVGARFMLENKSLTLANYQSLEDFETELLWMLNTS